MPRAAGREVGRELASATAISPGQALGDMLTALGFQPQIDHQPEGRLSCQLGNCPYDWVSWLTDVYAPAGFNHALVSFTDPSR